MAHGGPLRYYADDPELASQLLTDYTGATLDDQTRAILDYALLLTVDPSATRESDVEALRAVGLTDEQVLSTVVATSEFAFFTRVADGLGVEVPESMERGVRRWLSGPALDQDWLVHPK